MKGVAIALVAIARVAAADSAKQPPPASSSSSPADPAATRAGEANLESIDRRQGFTFGVLLGPSLTFGADVGTGGALTLRVGQVATPSTVITFELNGSAVFHRVEDTMNPEAQGRLVANNNASLLGGVAYWVNPSLFLRFGLGVGSYHCNECGAPDAAGKRGTEKYAGIAGGIGAGIDLARWRALTMSIEFHSVNLVTVDGMLWNNSVGLAFSID